MNPSPRALRSTVHLLILSIAATFVADQSLAAPAGRKVPATAPQPSASAPAGEPKTHALFMGLDLALEQQKNFYRVRDVSGDTFVINVNGKPVFVPVKLKTLNLKIEQSLKLTAVSATLTNVKGERGYTPGRDPQLQRQKAMMDVSAAIQDAASLSMGRYTVAQNNFGLAIDASASAGPSGAEAAAALEARAQEASAAAWKDNEMVTQMTTAGMTSNDFYGARARDDLALELFDAMDVTFEVSSGTPLNNPYVLIMTRFHEPNARVGAARNWVYASSLDPIDSQPRRITLQQGGFPRGFILDDFQVHLYNRGEEVATNVSPRRVALTRDEAFEYVMIDYVTKHKGDTLRASPAMGVLPPDFNARLSGGKLAQTFYVKVSKTGQAEHVFADEECTQAVQDPYVETLVKNIRFKPALDKGQPIDGVTPLKLGELRL